MTLSTPRPEAYAVFCGPIEQPFVQRIFSAAASLIQSGYGHIHILFQSNGGTVPDGVVLYNFFKGLPTDLTLYNAGSLLSIAAIAYLGAKKRRTSARATFMLHRSSISPQFATADSLQSIANGLRLDDRRTESILREHLTLSDEQWSELDKYRDLYFSGEEAVQIGLADEIGEFAPTKGEPLFNV